MSNLASAAFAAVLLLASCSDADFGGGSGRRSDGPRPAADPDDDPAPPRVTDADEPKRQTQPDPPRDEAPVAATEAAEAAETDTPAALVARCEAQATEAAAVTAAFAASEAVAENCGGGGYSSSNYTRTPEPAGHELHVVGVYEAANGPVTVTVAPTDQPVRLLLASAVDVAWRVEVAPGATLERVVVQARSGVPLVTGVPAGVPVVTRVFDAACAYAYGWEPAANTGGGDWKRFITATRAAFGEETSFQGCYSGARFTVPRP